MSTGWPICNWTVACRHTREVFGRDLDPDDKREVWIWQGGKALCWCHPDVEIPKGMERFPCSDSTPPPSPEEMAEVFKSLGVEQKPEEGS